MYTLDDILDDSSKFKNGMFISFPQFVYCSRVRLQARFFKGLGGTRFRGLWCQARRYLAWAAYNGCYASHSWRHKATYDVTAALWRHVVRGCLGDVSNEDLAIIENNQFTNIIE